MGKEVKYFCDKNSGKKLEGNCGYYYDTTIVDIAAKTLSQSDAQNEKRNFSMILYLDDEHLFELKKLIEKLIEKWRDE